MPPRKKVTKDFLKEVFAGRKHLIPRVQLRPVEVPKYDELSVVSLIADIMKEKELAKFFPEQRTKADSPFEAHDCEEPLLQRPCTSSSSARRPPEATAGDCANGRAVRPSRPSRPPTAARRNPEQHTEATSLVLTVGCEAACPLEAFGDCEQEMAHNFRSMSNSVAHTMAHIL